MTRSLKLLSATSGQHIYVVVLNNGVLNLDLLRLEEEMQAWLPCEVSHEFVRVDDVILSFFDVYKGGRIYELTMALGGIDNGYDDEWVLRRFLFLVDRNSKCQTTDMAPSPPFSSIQLMDTELLKTALKVYVPSDDDWGKGKGEGKESQERESTSPLPMRNHSKARATTPSPMRHVRWTDAKDHYLIRLVEEGTSWRDTARALGGREAGFSDDAVRNRHTRLEKVGMAMPRLQRRRKHNVSIPRGPIWTEHEDTLLAEAFFQHKFDPERKRPLWDLVALACGPRRTPASVRLRAQRLGVVKYNSPVASRRSIPTFGSVCNG